MRRTLSILVWTIGLPLAAWTAMTVLLAWFGIAEAVARAAGLSSEVARPTGFVLLLMACGAYLGVAETQETAGLSSQRTGRAA